MQPTPPLPSQFFPLDSPDATLDLVGGKALNLAFLVRAGYSVPNGFFIPTPFYRAYLAQNQLSGQINAVLGTMDLTSPDELAVASKQIRNLFSTRGLLPDFSASLEAGWRWLGAGPVAVRSSATAEDLPGMSFAGQQDTFLNVLGADALRRAVVDCWSSLWSARAIGYRARNGISQQDVALAVVVQNMVPSEAAGVLFTANPLTGLRSETVIDATWGLGEALVSGQVEPDHYVVDTHSSIISQRFLGSKGLVIRPKSGGGVITERQGAPSGQAIPDAVILQLTELGQSIETLFGFPQDIEWAWAGGELNILQSRPITSLFPLPAGVSPDRLQVFFSFAAVQGMLDPLTPIGRDAIREIFSAGARLFGVKVSRDTQSIVYTAGERLWIDFTPVLRNSVGRRIVPVVFSMVEPAVQQAIEQIWDDPLLQPGKAGISFPARRRIARFFVPLIFHVARNLVSPRKRRGQIIGNGERVLKQMEARLAALSGDRWERLAGRANLLPEFAEEHFPPTFLLFVSAVAAGMASWNFLNRLANSVFSNDDSSDSSIARDLPLEITRGMPYNPTTEMDLALWEMAKTLRRDPATCQVIGETPAVELSARYRSGDLPPLILQIVGPFLDRYGGRGLGEIDLGRKRWAEDPTYVFEMLGNYLQIESEDQAPDRVFAQGEEAAERAIARLQTAVRKKRWGRVKVWLARFFAGRARELMGMRESPKFFAVRMFWLVHRALLKSGAEFVQAGDLERPDDFLFLSFSELNAFAARQEKDWPGLIRSRRQAYEREQDRRQIPRLFLSDGRAFYEGLLTDVGQSGALTGSPVSPGSAEGAVRVVLNPVQSGLLPGEILVCPGTDPTWTPLFLSAAGLVMEVGGMMTHGAVVAREYGIPAIVGVDQATTRLRTGQRIRLDGSTGQILLLEDEPAAEDRL